MYANEANISFAAPTNYEPETMINTELATWLKANKLLQYGGFWPHDSKTCCPARNLKGNAINMVKMGNTNRKIHLTRKGEPTRGRRNPKEKVKPSGSRMLGLCQALMKIIYSG